MVGKTLGHYEVLDLLGTGGMGDVYRARDTKLDRDVAIKVLPEDLAGDLERLGRLEREAKLLAALNHPHIATIYSLEEAEGVRFLVLELIRGESLEQQLAKGPLPVEKALEICKQVAEALESAHAERIIHRDLKPANVLVTQDKWAKVLDFGIAKSVELGAAVDRTAKETNLTVEGTLVGTPSYMSPEQVRGQPIDKRSDNWAFGCLLFETLTGRTAFGRDTLADTLAAIIEVEPDCSALPAATPAMVEALIRRCLRKDPNRRLHDIADARIEIEEALEGTPSGDTRGIGGSRSASRHSLVLPGLLAATSAALALAAGLWAFSSGRTEPSEAASAITLHRLTDFTGLEEYPALSPDEKSIAFSAFAGGYQQIWIRLLGGGPPLQITDDPTDHRYPRWFPDSASLIYFSPPGAGELEGSIWEVAALGGNPRRVVSSLSEADVSADGEMMVFFRRAGDAVELVRAEPDGSDPQLISSFPGQGREYMHPRISPDGAWIAFERIGSDMTFAGELHVIPTAGGQNREIWRDVHYMRGLTWLADSSGIVFSSPSGSTMGYQPMMNLWAVGLESGESRQLSFGEVSYMFPDATASGAIVASRRRMDFDIWRFPIDGTPAQNVANAERITRQTGQVATPSVGPGDDEIAYLSDSGGHANIWITNADGSESRRVTSEQDPAVVVGLPVWAPNGSYIAFYYEEGAGLRQAGNFLVRPDGSGRRFLVEGAWSCWSWDSSWLYYSQRTDEVFTISKIAAAGGQPIVVRADNAIAPVLHPDGETLYYVAILESGLELRRANPEDGPSEHIMSFPTGSVSIYERLYFQPTISPDGEHLAIFLTDGSGTDLWLLPTDGGPLRRMTDFGDRRVFIVRRVSWSSDSRFVYAAVGEAEEDVVLLEGVLSGPR